MRYFSHFSYLLEEELDAKKKYIFYGSPHGAVRTVPYRRPRQYILLSTARLSSGQLCYTSKVLRLGGIASQIGARVCVCVRVSHVHADAHRSFDGQSHVRGLLLRHAILQYGRKRTVPYVSTKRSYVFHCIRTAARTQCTPCCCRCRWVVCTCKCVTVYVCLSVCLQASLEAVSDRHTHTHTHIHTHTHTHNRHARIHLTLTPYAAGKEAFTQTPVSEVWLDAMACVQYVRMVWLSPCNQGEFHPVVETWRCGSRRCNATHTHTHTQTQTHTCTVAHAHTCTPE